MSFRKVLITFALPAIFALSSCGDAPQKPSAGQFGFDAELPVGRVGAHIHTVSGGNAISGAAQGALQRGTDKFVNSSALESRGGGSTSVVPVGSGKVELSLVDASIPAAAEAVLKEALGLSYVVSNDVEGRVTVQTTGPIPKKALLDLFTVALDANNAQIERSGDAIKIVRGSSGISSFRMANDGIGSGNSILIAPLKYISAAEMAGLLEPLVGEGLGVRPDKSRNLVMLSGPPSALEASLDALNLFDVDVLQGKSVALVTLTSAEPDAVVEELRKIFSAEEGGALKDVIEFVPNNRLGSILVVTSRSTYLDKAKRWIRELDKSASQGTMILRTYPLSNRTAEEVAPILDGLFNDRAKEPSTSSDQSSSQSTGRPRIAADPARNALIVRAEGRDHTEIVAILRNLDTVARQVLLEATIAEVTLNDEVNIGTRWFFEKGNWGFRTSDLSSGAVSGNSPGFSAVFGAGGASVALSALSSVTDVKVISSPTLMVVDNRQGVLQIGDQVPIATQTSSATDEQSLAITQVSYRDTGIILTVLPRVGVGGRVSLDIEQEVSDVSATRASGIDSPTISTRRVSTSVVLADGQTLALGGLVQERDNKSRAQVPGAGNIPVLGALFGTRNSRKTRTELLILIRPRVVYDPAEAAAATSSWRNKLGNTSGILETGLGNGRHSVSEVMQ